MSQTLDLKELERKAWAPYVQDGLWDLFFGLLLVSTQVSAARGEQSFSRHLAASKIKNEFGYTYRYQKQLGDRPSYQYRNTHNRQLSNLSGRKRPGKKPN